MVVVRWRGPVVATLIAVVSLVSGCSAPLPQALRTPACRLFTEAQARLILLSPSVQVVASRVGYCVESGSGEGSRVTHLTLRVYVGSDAAKVPPGTGIHYGWYPNELVSYSPGKYVEGYWIPLTPTTTSLSALQGGILSASKDGYVVRAWVTDSPDAMEGTQNAVGVVLAHL